MNLAEMQRLLELTILAAPADPGRQVSAGYASDLLSCVMAKAGQDNVWITLQTHPNIVAVASLLGLSAVIVTEVQDQSRMDRATIEKASQEGIALYATSRTTYSVVAQLSRAGVPGVDM